MELSEQEITGKKDNFQRLKTRCQFEKEHLVRVQYRNPIDDAIRSLNQMIRKCHAVLLDHPRMGQVRALLQGLRTQLLAIDQQSANQSWWSKAKNAILKYLKKIMNVISSLFGFQMFEIHEDGREQRRSQLTNRIQENQRQLNAYTLMVQEIIQFERDELPGIINLLDQVSGDGSVQARNRINRLIDILN